MNFPLNSEESEAGRTRCGGCRTSVRITQSKGAVVSVPRLGACLGKAGLRAGAPGTGDSVAASACAS